MTTISAPEQAPLVLRRVTSTAGRLRPRAVPGWCRTASALAFWSVLVAVTALWVQGGGLGELGSVAGALTSTGRLTGLIASALLLVQVFLMARVPWFEQAWGQDELARTHRLVGFTSFNLMLAHILLITLGYAANGSLGLWGTIVDLVLHYPGMLLAVAGTLALVMVVVTSIKKARAKLRYESWHLIHLYAYLGAGLALPHQLWTGGDFTRNLGATVFWWTLYAVCLAAVVAFRIVLPLWRSSRAGLRVTDVRADLPGVTSVTVSGPGVASIRAHGGQFFQWRFLDGPGWSRANPYSLSAAPDGRSLRITVAHVGEGSARLATLRPGTRVLVEGPYGRLHAGVRVRDKSLLMASGIGITPLRALLEDLPTGASGDIVVIHRVRSAGEAILADELRALCSTKGARYVLVEGPRAQRVDAARPTWLPAQAGLLTDEEALLQVVPDITERDVFLCGSPGWLDAAATAVRGVGVPARQLHVERFTD